MLNKRIISAAAAVAVALGGVGAPVIGGFVTGLDLAASAYSYDYETFKQNCIDRGATNRMIEELDNFFLPNLDYFTAGDFATFIEKTDWLYENVMLPQSIEKYGKDPSELTDEERRTVVSEMGTQNQMQVYEFIRQVGEKHGINVGYDLSTGKIVPVCTVTRDEVPEKQYITVSAKFDADNETAPDYTKATVSVINSDGTLTHTQNTDAEGKVEITDLVKNGQSVLIELDGFAPREVVVTDDQTDFVVCKYGDLDGDGKVKLDDLIFMQKLVAGWKVNPVYDEVANVDVKGEVNVNDLILLQKYIAGWKVKLGPVTSDLPVVDD